MSPSISTGASTKPNLSEYFKFPKISLVSTLTISAVALASFAVPSEATSSNTQISTCANYPNLLNSHSFCPLSKYEYISNKLEEVQRKYYFETTIEPINESLQDFQEQVLDALNNGTFHFSESTTGVHKAPILYESKSEEPLGVMKKSGTWLTTSDVGDLIAYKLDHYNYAGVPPAFRITQFSTNGETVTHPVGTLVKWISNSHNITPSMFLSGDVEQLQAIAILDMRLGNADRHIGNFVGDDHNNIYPIDHDRIFYTYTRTLSTHAVYAEQPFTERAKKYIESLDVNEDIDILREHNVDQLEIKNFVIRTIFLKLAAESEEPILVEDVEMAIERAKLSHGNIGSFIEKYVYTPSVYKILNGFSQPYDIDRLKEAFKAEFLFAIKWARLRNAIKSILKIPFRALF